MLKNQQTVSRYSSLTSNSINGYSIVLCKCFFNDQCPNLIFRSGESIPLSKRNPDLINVRTAEAMSNRTFHSDDSVNKILHAASKHDMQTLKVLLRGNSTMPANVQDCKGYTPLHAAIASCATALSLQSPNTSSFSSNILSAGRDLNSSERVTSGVENAAETVLLLLQSGAVWNELDQNDETPACLARRLNLDMLYSIMVEAGEQSQRN